MKNIKKLCAASIALLFAVTITSCSAKDLNTFEVGILQYATHPALGKATDGFKKALEDKVPSGKKVNFTVLNPEGDATNTLTMANQLVRKSDLVLGNATPAATQLISSAATEGKNDLPILFTSVTDPVGAHLVSANSGAGHKENVTGTSDMNPIDQQVDMIFDFDSSVDKVGFIYNVSEVNSKTQCDEFKKSLKAKHPNCEVSERTVSDQTQISATVKKLIDEGCDCLYVPTDNLMAANVSTITNETNLAKIPVYGGESGLVDSGATMSLSISYYELGYTTGEMAAKILYEGVKANTIDVVSQTDTSKMEFVYSKGAMELMGLTFNDAFKTKYKVK